jgi:hypothetical protein
MEGVEFDALVEDIKANWLREAKSISPTDEDVG